MGATRNIGILPDSLVAAHPPLSADGTALYLSLIWLVALGKDIWKAHVSRRRRLFKGRHLGPM